MKPHEPLHRPGVCTKCWRPCRRVVDDADSSRCNECVIELVRAPEEWVRFALLFEDFVSVQVLDDLRNDGSAVVSLAARERLESGFDEVVPTRHVDVLDDEPPPSRAPNLESVVKSARPDSLIDPHADSIAVDVDDPDFEPLTIAHDDGIDW